MVRADIVHANTGVDPTTCEYILVVEDELITLAYVDDACGYEMTSLGTFRLEPYNGK